MKCPNCQHVASDKAILQCSHCGEAFERGPLEELSHLDYLQDWAKKNENQIGKAAFDFILTRATARVGELLQQIRPRQETPAVSTTTISHEPVAVPKPIAPTPAPSPVAQTVVSPAPASPPISAVAPQPPAVPTPKVIPAALPKPIAPPKPPAPPKPQRPPTDWKKVRGQLADAVTSGALLRALLYLGAFMIVISASVLVIRFWNQFNAVLQLLFIASVPLMFYSGGWLVRSRLKLAQAGTVLTGIGAILVAVDFAAIYQFGGLAQRVNGPVYWLVVAIFCTALYTFTARRLQGEFFDAITLLSGAGVIVALTRIPTPKPGLEWTVASVTLSGVIVAALAGRFKDSSDAWRRFARVARILSQILIPASLFYIFFSFNDLPIGIAFLFATIGYGILAWRFPTIVFAYAALIASIGTVIYSLRYADVQPEWYAMTASILALAYILIGQRVDKAKLEAAIIQRYIRALNVTGLILIGVASVGGFIVAFSETWAGVLALTIAAFDLVLCAYFFKQARYTLFASALFIVPFSFAFWQWFADAKLYQPFAWLTVAWLGLALAYTLLAVLLRKIEDHASRLYAVAHFITPLALIVLPFEYLARSDEWKYIPTSTTLGLSAVFYLLSIVLRDNGGHAALSKLVKWLPFGLGKSIFFFPAGLLFPIWIAVGWYGTNLIPEWFGAALTGFGAAYIGIGQGLFKRASEYRLPLHIYPYFFFLIGIPLAMSNQYALLVALSITIAALGLIAYFYNRAVETTLASLLTVWLFTTVLDLLKVPPQAHGLAFILLACLIYTPVGVYLNNKQKSRERFHPIPIFIIGYALSVYAVFNSVMWSIANTTTPWISALAPLIATALYVFSEYYFRNESYSMGWAWLSVFTLAITFRQTLTLFEAPPQHDAFAWVMFAALYMILERLLARIPETNLQKRFWFDKFRMPLVTGFIAIAVLSLALNLPGTLAAFSGANLKFHFPVILAQTTLVILVIASARLYRTRVPLYIEPALAFLPVTLFFIGYGEQLFGQALTTPQYALAWAGLGIAHILAGILTDHSKERYAHGLYLGGYTLASWAVLWSLIDRPTLAWTLGLWILASIASALLVHFNKHQTWSDLIHLLFGKSQGLIPTTTRNLFQWLAAWTFPIWCVIFLREINVLDSFSWLGLVVPSLAYLGLALWLRTFASSYAAPLYSAAQFYTVIGLIVSAPVTFDFLVNYNIPVEGKDTLLAALILQSVAVVFYATSAWMSKTRKFAHIAAWLSVSAFSVAWQAYGVELTPIILIVPWLIWSAVLLAVGFVLDKNQTRYSHGPYLAGYALMTYALALSTANRVSNIYALAISILLAVISYLVVHFGWHHTFEDFINAFWKKADETARQIASTIFLFFAAYAFPIFVAQVLTHNEYSLAWRGMGLALIAPIYITIGIAIGNSKPRGIPTVPTWALYSAAYALTAIGAMVAFEDERMAIYVLTLDAVVYAVSAYLFRQSFWLYLTTVLTPIIVLLTLHNADQLKTNLVAWIFMGFAFLYLAIGQLFDRIRAARFISPAGAGDMNIAVHPFAAPFYAPGFLLSAISLALASNERTLAIQVYSAGVILYALSSLLLRETLFYYPAAWLAAVPYFLGVTLTSLETRWYGLAWLPLILLYIGLGRFVFHTRKLVPLGRGFLADWLTHPAVPFYLLAYALSVSMISLSYVNPLALTIAFGVAAVIYFTSSYLFKKPAWIYAGLFAAHMTALAYFTINPSGGEPRYITIPFLAMTWLTSLIGYAFERRTYPALSVDEASEDEASEKRTYRYSILEHLFGHPWARPFFAFAIVEMIIWQSLALTGTDTTIISGIGYALLFALFSILWVEGALVYGAVGFSLLAAGASLKQAEVGFAAGVAVFGGIGFGLYLVGRILEALSSRLKALTVWLTPLTYWSIALTGAAVLINLPFIANNMTAAAATFAFAGALYVTIAYRGKYHRLGYVGMALLELAWVLALVINDVAEPQWYAIPGGLYFMGLGYLEWTRSKSRYAVGLEVLGLGVLLVTSLAQSLNGAEGFPYFILLIAEGLLVIWWGVYQKRKIPFFTGIGASAINIAAQVIVLISVYDINRWLVAFGVGLIIMAMAIYIERSREQLRARAQELSETLEKWE